MARPKKNVEGKEIKRNGRTKIIIEPTLEQRVKLLEEQNHILLKNLKEVQELVIKGNNGPCEECVKEENEDWLELLKLFEEKVDKPENKKRPINITIRTSYRKPFNFDDTWLFF